MYVKANIQATKDLPHVFFCARPLLQVFHLDLSDCLVSGFLGYAAQSTTVEQSDWSRDLGCIAVACGMVVVVS